VPARARRSGAARRACVGRPRAAAYGSPSPGAFVSMCKDGEPPPLLLVSRDRPHHRRRARASAGARHAPVETAATSGLLIGKDRQAWMGINWRSGPSEPNEAHRISVGWQIKSKEGRSTSVHWANWAEPTGPTGPRPMGLKSPLTLSSQQRPINR
jgi:hypothetical protein